MQVSSARAATLFVAGMMGLAGVVSAAAAAHAAGDPRLLGGASAMCLAHAPALIALYAGWTRFRTAAPAALLLAAGTALFAGDLTARHLGGSGLFPMSAPTGGVIMMAGWVMVALGAFLPSRNA